MNKLIKRFVKEDRGVTALEYALIGELIAAALVDTIPNFTAGLNDAFPYIVKQLKTS